jgi:hypothetical protein
MTTKLRENDGQFRLILDETKPKGGRPPNLLIPKLMKTDGVSRATAYRRLKAKHEAQLLRLARTGNGHDHKNQHPQGYYSTPPRGTRALLVMESFHGTIWEPCCGDGAISRELEAAGHEVISTDIVDRGYGRGDHNFLTDHTTTIDDLIMNPPYGPQRDITVRFIEHALTRIRPGGKVCVLLRANWEAAQSHRHLIAKCCRKYTFTRRLQIHRGGYTGRKGSPQMDTAWYVFMNEHTGPMATVALPPECGEELPLLLERDANPGC